MHWCLTVGTSYIPSTAFSSVVLQDRFDDNVLNVEAIAIVAEMACMFTALWEGQISRSKCEDVQERVRLAAVCSLDLVLAIAICIQAASEELATNVVGSMRFVLKDGSSITGLKGLIVKTFALLRDLVCFGHCC